MKEAAKSQLVYAFQQSIDTPSIYLKTRFFLDLDMALFVTKLW